MKEILEFAWELISEEMNFKEIRQSKEYKGLAKIIQFCTPWILKSKIEENVELKFVDKYNYKASQYNHETNKYIKPKLSERTKKIWENIIQRDLLNQQVATLENEEFNKIIEEMGESVSIAKKEIIFSQGNPDVIRNIVLNKVVEEKAKGTDFEKKEKDALKIIKDNVLANFYVDLEIRKKVQVTHEEIVGIYESEKGKLGNVTPNDAYNQIGNGLVNNKVNEERTNIINRIIE